MPVHSCNAVLQAFIKNDVHYIVIENVELEVTEEQFKKIVKSVRMKEVEDYRKIPDMPEPYKDRIYYGRDGGSAAW
jgi:hypothetical protein